MQIKVRVQCNTCNGSGYVSWVDHEGMTRENPHKACKGTGWVEEWIAIDTLLEYSSLLCTAEDNIERLEQIILAMEAGSESSGGGDVFPGHTHWVYPLNEAKNLVEEIENKAEADHCAKCGGTANLETWSFFYENLCAECESA